MFPEHDIVLHVNNVDGVLWVIFLQKLQDLQLHTCLVVVLLFVFDDFHGDELLSLVVEALDSNAERAPTQVFDQLVPIGNVVLQHEAVVALRIVEAIVFVIVFSRSRVVPIL